jgi:hypothetical protein
MMSTTRMKYILPIILPLLFCFQGFSQPPIQFTYDGMYHGRIDGKQPEFKEISVDLELIDSIYLIRLNFRKDRKHLKSYRFMGFYSLDSEGTLKLTGEHPFQESDYVIRKGPVTEASEDDKRYDYLKQLRLTFLIKLKEKWSGKKQRKAELESIKKNYKYSPGLFENHTYSYMPEFYPGYYGVFRKKEDRDSLFELFDNKSQDWISYSNRSGEVDDMKDEEKFFRVDSMRFDTIYINKLLKTKNGLANNRDTIDLSQTLKTRLDYTRMGASIEESDLFMKPKYASEIVYSKQEVDRIKNIRITDYVKDEFGIEWIKIEVDVQIYNEKAEEYSERYFSKTVSGWIFQKALQVY